MQRIASYQIENLTETQVLLIDSWVVLFELFTKKYKHIVWVVDDKLKSLIPFDENQYVIEISGGEDCKSLNYWLFLIEKFSESKVDRRSHIVAIGGGSVADLVGFAAAVYLRGITFSLVPSTLLCLIDAGLGGKNGINFQGRKNQIGTIVQPENIIYTPSLIRGLPSEKMAEAFAEIIKYSLIMDKGLFDKLMSLNLGHLMSNQNILQDIIKTCIIHKSKVVAEDPFEQGKRRILNFGHTLGHAIESLYTMPHGNAVALGMCFAARMSELKYPNLFNISEKIKTLLRQFELPTSLEPFHAEMLFDKIIGDKKREHDDIHFVFLRDLGQASVEAISMNELRSHLFKAEREGWMQ